MLRIELGPAWFLKLALLGFSSQGVFDDLVNHASRISISKLGSFCMDCSHFALFLLLDVTCWHL